LRLITALSAVVILGLLSTFSGAHVPSAVPKRVTEANAGAQIELRVGELLVVALAGNPTTGYQWEVVDLDASIVKQLGEATLEPSSAAIGAGGLITLQFRAVGIGETALKVVYRRPFEKEVPPLRVFAVTVIAK